MSPITEKELIERYLPLVRNVVDRITSDAPAHIDADDLYIIGVSGLVFAVKKFDPYKRSIFASYAANCIRSALLDELRRADWCPRRARARNRKIRTVSTEIEKRIGRIATENEICAALNINAEEYADWAVEARLMAFSKNGLEPESNDAGIKSLHELLCGAKETVESHKLETEVLTQIFISRIAELPDMPKKILAMYYFENMSLAEIAALFGLTESRICQIHAQTILSLRAYMQRARDH